MRKFILDIYEVISPLSENLLRIRLNYSGMFSENNDNFCLADIWYFDKYDNLCYKFDRKCEFGNSFGKDEVNVRLEEIERYFHEKGFLTFRNTYEKEIEVLNPNCFNAIEKYTQKTISYKVNCAYSDKYENILCFVHTIVPGCDYNEEYSELKWFFVVADPSVVSNLPEKFQEAYKHELERIEMIINAHKKLSNLPIIKHFYKSEASINTMKRYQEILNENKNGK